MTTNNSGPVLTREEVVSVTLKLSESLYIAHIHAGKAHISPLYAVQAAATIIGVIQSDEIAKWIDSAIKDPLNGLALLGESWRAFNRMVDDSNGHKIDRLAAAIEREKSVKQTQGK